MDQSSPNILVAPLDWGLGHATRCIPVIRALMAAGASVWIAAEGSQEALLREEFPALSFLPLKGYNVSYGRSGPGLFGRILIQTPSILKTIRQEHLWLKVKMKEHHFDAVISDNRYGIYHKDIPSVFITHQLNIKSPATKLLGRLIQKRNYRYINRFSDCWVPDLPGSGNLAGELSHPINKPVTPIRYIGLLSRMRPQQETEKKDHLLIVISGPEPQRTIFENKIIRDISHYPGTATIVRGLPGSATILPSTSMIRFYNHLPSDLLNKEMAMAEYVISRSGYSTVMDIVSLGKKSILIPTPGQPEQEYLGKILMEKNLALSIPIKSFTLTDALQRARSFEYKFVETHTEGLLDQAIRNLLSSLRNKNS